MGGYASRRQSIHRAINEVIKLSDFLGSIYWWALKGWIFVDIRQTPTGPNDLELNAVPVHMPDLMSSIFLPGLLNQGPERLDGTRLWSGRTIARLQRATCLSER